MRQISTIGIVTADRPASLQRAVASLVVDREVRRPRRVVIVDGSRMAENRRATKTIATRAAAETGWLWTYIGPSEAARFRRALGTDRVSAQALSGGRVAPNRNLLLLLTAGEHILFLDDDIVAEARSLPGRRQGFAVVGHEEHRAFHFFRNRKSALNAFGPARATVLATHDELLGRPVSALLASQAPVEPVQGCGHVMSRLRKRLTLTVRLTSAGLVGDAATYCPQRLLLSGPGSLRQYLWSSQRAFRAAMTSRESARVATTNYVTHSANCMSYCMGLSNRAVVPPFPWIGGNEDGVFGALLGMMDLSAVFGHLSIAVIHDSARHSRYGRGEARSAVESRISELLIAIFRQLTPSLTVTSPAARLRHLGLALVEIGSLRPSEFRSFVIRLTLAMRRREFDAAEQASRQSECPPYWRRALAEYRRTFTEHSTSEGFCLPTEFRQFGSLTDGFDRLRRFLREFGGLLESWPELWDAARLLNQSRSGRARRSWL